jgi:hypothetical protein
MESESLQYQIQELKRKRPPARLPRDAPHQEELILVHFDDAFVPYLESELIFHYSPPLRIHPAVLPQRHLDDAAVVILLHPIFASLFSQVFATFFAFFLPPFLPSLLYLRSSSAALLLSFSRFTEDKALVGQEDHATALPADWSMEKVSSWVIGRQSIETPHL